MRWSGQNRTETGASLRPLGAIIGAEAYGADLTGTLPDREHRRFARILKHRHLLCLRRMNVTPGTILQFAHELDAGPISSVLKAPANIDERQNIAFIDQDLLNRAGVIRPEFIYRHEWRKGDVLIWTNRLRLTS